MTTPWHIVTPEFPPECGGVGDYTAQVAEALAQSGDAVTVYVPHSTTTYQSVRNVELVVLPDRFGARSRRLLASGLDAEPRARLLVQYVPAVFGRRGANMPFCRWLLSRRDNDTDVRVMFHEPYLYLRWRPDHIVIAFTQRAMAGVLLDAATHVYLSTDTWRRYLGRLRSDAVQKAVTLPIPSAIPCVDAAQAVRATRTATAQGATYVVGHFGSYGSHIAPLLRRVFTDLLSSSDRIVALCAGSGSDRFVADLLTTHPALRGRVTASGRASAHDISVQLQACDLLVQPYPDGVTTRRTSVMAGLANGSAIVTTNGKLTENVWRASRCVALADATDCAGLVGVARDLLADVDARQALQRRASAAYDAHFALPHTIEALRSDSQMTAISDVVAQRVTRAYGQF